MELLLHKDQLNEDEAASLKGGPGLLGSMVVVFLGHDMDRIGYVWNWTRVIKTCVGYSGGETSSVQRNSLAITECYYSEKNERE